MSSSVSALWITRTGCAVLDVRLWKVDELFIYNRFCCIICVSRVKQQSLWMTLMWQPRQRHRHLQRLQESRWFFLLVVSWLESAFVGCPLDLAGLFQTGGHVFVDDLTLVGIAIAGAGLFSFFIGAAWDNRAWNPVDHSFFLFQRLAGLCGSSTEHTACPKANCKKCKCPVQRAMLTLETPTSVHWLKAQATLETPPLTKVRRRDLHRRNQRH